MSKFLTNTTKHAVINALRGASWSVDSLTVALFTAAPTVSTGGTEVVGGSYARQPMTLATPGSGASSNTANVAFVNMPACTVLACAICDGVTGDILWVNDGLSMVCAAGSNKLILPSDLDVSFPAAA